MDGGMGGWGVVGAVWESMATGEKTTIEKLQNESGGHGNRIYALHVYDINFPI